MNKLKKAALVYFSLLLIVLLIVISVVAVGSNNFTICEVGKYAAEYGEFSECLCNEHDMYSRADGDCNFYNN